MGSKHSPPGTVPESARQLAATLLARVVDEGAFANLALGAALGRSRLEGPDRGFCTELLYGTLRHLHVVDAALAKASGRALSRIQPELLNLARVAAYEALVLGSPDHALVHAAVELARKRRGEGGAKFVNGVLRGLLRLRDSGALLPSTEAGVKGLVARTGLPEWLAQDVIHRLGDAEAERFGAASLDRPHVHLSVPRGEVEAHQVLDGLKAAGKDATPFPLCPTAVVLKEGAGVVEDLPPVQQGMAFVQDAASQLVAGWAAQVASRLGASPCVLDLCAAPGGKSAVMAAKGLRVVSGDVHVDKLHLARRQWQRMRVAPVAVAMDAAQPPFAPASADMVLLDAPCTGTGLLSRRPEIKLRRASEDLARLVELQARLLDAAAPLVRPGGSLLYSVCSVTTAEGPAQVAAFLARHPDWHGVPGEELLPQQVLEHGMLALWPQRHGTDGFFAAHLQRTSSGVQADC